MYMLIRQRSNTGSMETDLETDSDTVGILILFEAFLQPPCPYELSTNFFPVSTFDFDPRYFPTYQAITVET